MHKHPGALRKGCACEYDFKVMTNDGASPLQCRCAPPCSAAETHRLPGEDVTEGRYQVEVPDPQHGTVAPRLRRNKATAAHTQGHDKRRRGRDSKGGTAAWVQNWCAREPEGRRRGDQQQAAAACDERSSAETRRTTPWGAFAIENAEHVAADPTSYWRKKRRT
jgi:hypothetical protein